MTQALQVATSNDIEELPFDRFYQASEKLTKMLADRIDSLEAEAIAGLNIQSLVDEEASASADFLTIGDLPGSVVQDSSAELTIQQRIIAEELYHCLADAAESDEARDGGKLRIHTVITERMADALGLEQSDDLLRQLSDEFQNWIDGLGSVTTGWGDIISTNDGYMYLKMFPIDEEAAIPPDLTFIHPYRGGEIAKPATTLLGRIAVKLGVG